MNPTQQKQTKGKNSTDIVAFVLKKFLFDNFYLGYGISSTNLYKVLQVNKSIRKDCLQVIALE
jgi:hypothetical protein